jgi:TPR repeat protein
VKRKLQHTIASILLIVRLGAPITVAAGPLEDVGVAYGKGDYATGLRLLGPLADQGSARAQTILGVMYANGHGVPQNYGEAMKWYRLAADQGDAAAQAALGVIYANGLGVPQDRPRGVEWTRKAADQGYANAQNNLGTCTRGARAYRRITARPSNGIVWLPIRATPARRIILQ